MKKITTLIFSLAIISQAICQESERDILDKFFETYKENSSEAIDYIYSFNKWIDAEGDAVKQLKSQLKQSEELVGEYHGEEFLFKGELGESFVTYIYFAKYERQPIRFTFEFYKPNNKWIVYSFKFDDSFDDDLENIMKYEYMRSNY